MLSSGFCVDLANIYSTPSPSVPSSPQCDQTTGLGGVSHSVISGYPAGLLLDHTHSVLLPFSFAIPCGWSYQVVPTYLYPFVPALSIESKKLFFSVVEPFLGYFNESLSSHNAYTNCILLPSSPGSPVSPVILNGFDQ